VESSSKPDIQLVSVPAIGAAAIGVGATALSGAGAAIGSVILVPQLDCVILDHLYEYAPESSRTHRVYPQERQL
jgi:hypothetical protein